MHHLKFWIFKIILIVLAAIFLVGWVTMLLWNWLIPELFKGPAITFWQALGLLLLSKILFSGFKGRERKGHFPRHHHWKQKFEEKLNDLQDKMKEKFDENASRD